MAVVIVLLPHEAVMVEVDIRVQAVTAAHDEAVKHNRGLEES
jgi:hypothetical protein